MLLGRAAELKQLNHYYDREGSQIVVVYGQKNIGKTALVKEFAAGKPSSYYMARSASDREQVYQWGMELAHRQVRTLAYPSYGELLQGMLTDMPGKQIVIIDEFQHIIKTSPGFMKELVAFVHKQWNSNQVLVLLCSSSIGWVENSMIQKIGESAYELSGLLKLKELKFSDMMDYFPGYSKDQCVECYAILGGMPGLWKHFSDKLSVKENIIRSILSSNGGLRNEAMSLITDELRETAVYNTILASIASGKHKLNELYAHTGFSRAKISVYLKNLMELEIVEKVFSVDTDGKDNVQKGIYRIKNHFVYFYFKFLYPNRSGLAMEAPSAFYLEYVAPGIRSFAGEYFKDVCQEYLDVINRRGVLPITYESSGEWVGKPGTIDIVATDEEGRSLIALCSYDKAIVTYEEYEKLLYCAEKAKINAQYVYLFSMNRFDEKVELEARLKKNLYLISMKEAR